MRRFILDTGVAGLYLDRRRGVFERAVAEVSAANRVRIAGPVVGELAFRAEGSSKREQNLLRLREALDVWRVWLADIRAEFEYGRMAFKMKRMCRLIGQNDMSAIPGLSVENWADPLQVMKT